MPAFQNPVNAHSQPTRTPVRVGHIQQVVGLDFRDEFFASGDGARQLITDQRARFDEQSPAARRLLLALVELMIDSYSDSDGYKFRPVSRRELALELDRAGALLVPHDIRLLRGMVEDQLVIEQRRALPIRKKRGADGQELWYGSSSEYIYTLARPMLIALLWDNDQQRPRLKQMAQTYQQRRAHKRASSSTSAPGTSSEIPTISASSSTSSAPRNAPAAPGVQQRQQLDQHNPNRVELERRLDTLDPRTQAPAARPAQPAANRDSFDFIFDDFFGDFDDLDDLPEIDDPTPGRASNSTSSARRMTDQELDRLLGTLDPERQQRGFFRKLFGRK